MPKSVKGVLHFRIFGKTLKRIISKEIMKTTDELIKQGIQMEARSFQKEGFWGQVCMAIGIPNIKTNRHRICIAFRKQQAEQQQSPEQAFDEPDVCETSDLPADDQAQFESLGESCGVETPQQKYQRLVNEIQERIQELETIQVSQLYDAGPEWDAVSTSILQVAQRLVAVKELHEQTMQPVQLLTHLDTTQQMTNNSLKDNNNLLTQVQQTMEENRVVIKESFAALDQRMKKLSK